MTGGAGFLGSHLCDYLLASGCEVVCVDNMNTGSVGNLAGALEQEAFSVVRHDVVQPFALDGDVDLIFHLASPASPMHYLRHPIATMKVALYGTVNMLEFARSKRARFVLASSSEIYGDPLVQPQPEGYWGNVLAHGDACKVIGRPSVGQRPVAALGASHREALVSRGPSQGQASKALSRRWSASLHAPQSQRANPLKATKPAEVAL